MKIKNLDVGNETLNQWIENLLPEYDIFFFPRHHEMLIEELRPNALVMPFSEFSSHNGFNNINTLNSYQLWQLTDDVAYACVVQPEVIATIDASKRKEILRVQKSVNRGLIFEWDFLSGMLDDNHPDISNLQDSLSPFLFEFEGKSYLSLQTSLWNSLDTALKYMLLLSKASEFVDDVKITDQQMNRFKEGNPHISRYFNSFSKWNGANCFAATLASISTDADIDWLIFFWIHQEGFKSGLKANGYKFVSTSLDTLQSKDVLLWKNGKNIVHASYYLGDGFFFNKHGQSFITPWQIVSTAHMYKIWGSEGIEIYRKTEDIIDD
ncbi:MAG TPA: hypothetical protein VK142_02185 [Bacillota bacterium]|nr:hypothetical protein [Bacillota bacterium]